MQTMLRPVIIGNATLYLGDCMDVLPTLPRVDAVITDPPYFKVKGDYWDNEWDKPHDFLDWMRGLVGMLADRLASNGSLYLFASPQMAGRVESVIWERLAVLGHIVWRKGKPGAREITRANAADKAALRAFFQTSERIIFAEHRNSDSAALGESGYDEKCDELRGFVFEPLRAYLAGEFERAGMLNQAGKIAANVACGFSASAGGMASRHYFSRSQWQLPTPEHYQALRDLLNREGGNYLRREYEDLRREYEDLRREYEDLRREYEDLRRPFSLSDRDQWSDVWDFDPVSAYPGKHPCEKPVPLLAHMLKASTRPGAVVLDAFMGSGATGDAALRLGRKFIGIERDAGHFEAACRRIDAAHRARDMFADDPRDAYEMTQQQAELLEGVR